MHDPTATLSHSDHNLFRSDVVEGLSRLQRTIPSLAVRRDARVLSWSVRQEAKKEKLPDRATQVGDSARLAQNGVRDRDNHVRKSRNQCPNPDAAHSRDDRGSDDGAHRDAELPKAIGITLIDTVRDQHRSQP